MVKREGVGKEKKSLRVKECVEFFLSSCKRIV